MVQWLRRQTPNAEGPSLIPGQGTRSHVLQLRVHKPQQKILHAAVTIKDPSAATKTFLPCTWTFPVSSAGNKLPQGRGFHCLVPCHVYSACTQQGLDKKLWNKWVNIGVFKAMVPAAPQLCLEPHDLGLSSQGPPETQLSHTPLCFCTGEPSLSLVSACSSFKTHLLCRRSSKSSIPGCLSLPLVCF